MTCELLGSRDVYTFLESVRAYIDWRIASHKRRFISWRNQPPEVGNLVHAILLLNLASNAPAVFDADRAELFRSFGQEVERAKFASRCASLSLSPRKQVRSEVARRRAA